MTKPIQIERRATYREAYAIVRPAVREWAGTPGECSTIDCPACGGRLAVSKSKAASGVFTALSASCSTPFCVTFTE